MRRTCCLLRGIGAALLRRGRRPLRLFLIVLVVPIALTVLHTLAGALLTLIPANRTALPVEEGVEIFLFSNGVHVELALPVKAEDVDWGKFLKARDFGTWLDTPKYLGFGWGERRFLQEVPKWDDLSLGVAVTATLWPTPAAMSVVVLSGPPPPASWNRRVVVARENYAALAQFIRQSFTTDPTGEPILIGPCEYTKYARDNFYEANGAYHLFRTCNVWTNQALQEAGLRTAVWAPFASSVFHHFPRSEW